MHPFTVAVVEVTVVDIRLKIKVFRSVRVKRSDFCFLESMKRQMDDVVEMIELTN